MQDSRSVLVIDDDPSVTELMRDFLENEQFVVYCARSADHALQLLQQQYVNCILLDIMMPGQSGFDLCRKIRAASHVPILFLSARGDESDKIRGLGLGGDDYIVKTASPAEVVARVKAVLRRYRLQERTQNSELDFGRLALDIRARQVIVDGKQVPFTPREFDLLCLFAEHPMQVFAYDQLLERFWDGIGDKHTVTVHVGRIRDKIEPDATNPSLIVNVWGVGYRFEGRMQ